MTKAIGRTILFTIISFVFCASCLGQGKALYDTRDLSIIEKELQLEIPDDAWIIYVIYQEKGPIVEGTSESPFRGSKEEFLRNFVSFLEEAKRSNRKFVVTAETEDQRWVHDKIIYEGSFLRPTTYRDPHGMNRNFPGSEIPYH